MQITPCWFNPLKTTLAKVRCTEGSNCAPSGTKNSPHRKNPKKPVHEAAQMSMFLSSVGAACRDSFIWHSRVVVMGSRVLFYPSCTRTYLMP